MDLENLRDLHTILSKIGKVAGAVKVYNMDSIASDITDEFSNEVKSAKGIYLEFEILPTSSIVAVNDVMCFINDNIDENCEVIYTTQTNEDLPQNSIKCKILFTGLA